ncbi:guanine nucleotide binding protein, alpha subunit [Paraphysoderma sedebokerense]|nr:guanine nucleotide binding protein, alpha subunit [Paraphysoderma sedebokerense]
MLILIQQAETYQYEYETEEAKEFAKYISALDVEESEELDPKVTKAIETLWKDNAIKQTFERKTEYWILEASDYYFDNFARFMEDDFVPTEEDIVMARVMTVGITTTEVSVPPCQVTLVDVGGQRNERRKWIHCFDNVNAIIFVVNLAGYNMVLFEDPTQNRMKECFNLFKQTVNNEVFANTPLYLLFNKKDLFEKKIRKEPITVCECFTDYKGTGEIKDALDYIDDLFRSQITAGDPKRLTVFHVAARYKRDIKTCWDDIINDIKSQNKKDIEAALNALGKTDP